MDLIHKYKHIINDKMRHLNQYDITNESSNSSNIDMNISDLKVEMPYLNLLSDCETLIKNEFSSDEELQFEFNTESESFETSKKQCETRKNKRKPLVPQRTIQSDLNQKNLLTETNFEQHLPDIIENSDSAEDNLFSQIYLGNDIIFSDTELPESEDLLRDIDEENIFKGIQEEAGMFRLIYCVAFNFAFVFFCL